MSETFGFGGDPGQGIAPTQTVTVDPAVKGTSPAAVINPPTGGLQMPASSPPSPAPAPTTQAQTFAPAANYSGNSIVDFLSAAGQPTDFNSRAALASKYGISNYSGTAAQNTQLLGILKAHATGNVDNLGIPKNIGDTLGVNSSITPGSPIPASSLTGPGTGGINDILNSGVNNNTLDSTLAGILAAYGQPSPEDTTVKNLNDQITQLMGQENNQGADTTAAEKAAGIPDMQKNVQDLSVQAAQQKGALEKFDAETMRLKQNIQDQPIAQEFVNTQTDKLQRDRDITKTAMAAELSATTALIQAYNGNIDTATKMVETSINLKYQPIENQIKILQTQLSAARDSMTKADAARADVITALLKNRQDEIDKEKQTQKDIQTLTVQAASAGAPLSVVNKMKAAKDATEAASIGNVYLKAPIEKAGGVGGSGSGSSTAIKFTQSDIQRLTATGLTSKDIANIQADINAHGIDAVLPGLPEAQRKVVQDVLKGVTPSQAGSSTSKQYLSTDYLKANIDQKELESDALAAGYFTKGGGLFNTGLFASKKPDVNAYVNSLMDQIKNLRAQGKDDDTILKTLGFAK